MLLGGAGVLRRTAATPAHPSRTATRAITSPTDPHVLRGSGGLQARTGALQLARRRRQLSHLRRVPNTPAAGSWDDWDDEDADFVAEASSSTPDAASWGSWQQQEARQQHQQQHQQQQGVAAAAPAAAALAAAGFTGREGETKHSHVSTSGRQGSHSYQQQPVAQVAAMHAMHPPPPRPTGVEVRYFTGGAIAAVALHYVATFAGTLPVVRGLVRRFIWWSEPRQPAQPPSQQRGEAGGDGSGGGGAAAGAGGSGTTAMAVQYSEDEESVEWVNMCWRKAWRVYQRGLERWLADLLQPLFDSLVADKMVPSFVQRLRIMEFTLDHEAPYFTNMRRRTSRKDSDLNGVVDVRYTGGARMLLLIEVGTDRWRIKIPVLVSDLDLESSLWLKIRLAPMCPYVGTIGLGFVGQPSVKVQLAPYNRIRLMKIPILQAFLTKLLTIDLPGLITLPKRLEINIPPAVTAVAEAAVGRDAVMRAVASAVLQADALEHALLAALPLGPQGAAGGVSLPDLFRGELQVTLHEARDLPVWGFPWQSNPYCRMTLGSQAVQSRRDDDTSHAGRHRAPVWNQDFQFLVEDPLNQTLYIWIGDSPMTGRTEVGRATFALSHLEADGTTDVWLPVESSMPGERTQGAVRLIISYRPFEDDIADSGYRAAAAFAVLAQQSNSEITDVKSAADASSRAAVAASAAAAAVAVTKAAAARAAARIARGARQLEVDKQLEKQQQQLEDGSSSSLSGSSSRNGSGPEPTGAAARPAVGGGNGSKPAAGHAASSGSSSSGAAGPSQNGTNEASSSSSISVSSARKSSTVEQLNVMAATMQKLTAEVDGIVHSGSTNGSTEGTIGRAIDDEVKAAAVEAVAAAEAAAISAVAAGDLIGANQVLQDAAAALESTVAQLAAAESGSRAKAAAGRAGVAASELRTDGPRAGKQTAATPQARAEEALAAAHAAAAQAADAAAVAYYASTAVEFSSAADMADAAIAATAAAAPGGSGGGNAVAGSSAAAAAAGDAALSSSDEDAVGLDALPASEAAEERDKGLPAYDAEAEAASKQQQQQESQPWWLAIMQWLPGAPSKGDQAAAAAAAEADGGSGGSGDGHGPLRDVIIPADLPLEEIAAEVQRSWKLRDMGHVERLVQQAMDAQQKQKDKPLLQLLAIGSAASAVLLAAVLWRLAHMP